MQLIKERKRGRSFIICKKENIGKLDFLIELNGKIVALEVKSVISYKTHNALAKFLAVQNYKIHTAYILSLSNIEKSAVLPISRYTVLPYKGRESRFSYNQFRLHRSLKFDSFSLLGALIYTSYEFHTLEGLFPVNKRLTVFSYGTGKVIKLPLVPHPVNIACI